MINFNLIPQTIKNKIHEVPLFFELAPERQAFPYMTYTIVTDMPFSDFCNTYNKPILQIALHTDLQKDDVFALTHNIITELDDLEENGIRFVYLSTVSLPRQRELPNIATMVLQFEVWER